MCGIVGILNRNSQSTDNQKALIRKMIAPLLHRGPDGWGTYCSQDIALGHSRLSIIDLSGGSQPMNSDRYVISFNGEIYNYLELREELIKKGVQFTSRSDTEVLMKVIEIYGESGIAKLNGQFAFLFWDKKEKRLIVCRDRYGVRPLYILHLGESIYFASEMKSFDQIPRFQREYDHKALFEHGLLWNTLADQTVWKNIRSVEPGTYEVFNGEFSHSIKRYYSLGETCLDATPPKTISDAEERLRYLLKRSVEFRLRSDVPVGVYISGGIDSSVIAAITSSIQKNTFKTFSITFSDSDYDESQYQREMVFRIGSEHDYVNVDYQKIRDTFMDAIYHCERPVFRTAPIPLFLLSKLVREHGIKVVLTGEASDEILFGYDSFKELKLIKFWQRQPSSSIRPLLIRKLYPHLKHYAESKQYGLLKTYYEDFFGACDNELVGSAIRVANNAVLAHAINKDSGVILDKNVLQERIRTIVPQNYNYFSDLQKNQFVEMRTLLSGYLLSSQGDRMSMAHSVEGRYPFLDHNLVEEVFSWPDSFKLSGFEQKYVLRRAYKEVVPKSIIDRPKLPYQAPDLKSFVGPGGLFKPASDFLSADLIKDYGVFDYKFIDRFVRKFSNGPREQIGYRDNMLMTFILSAQIALYWAKNPRQNDLSKVNQIVDITE